MNQDQINTWLKAAYSYYLGDGDYAISDQQWDYQARMIYKDKKLFAMLPEAVQERLKECDWDGGSLFFVRAKDYPDWCKE